MLLRITNTYVYIEHKFQTKDQETKFNLELREKLSYNFVGKDFSPKYKTGVWDGKISLYQKYQRKFPTGLISKVKEYLNENDYVFSVKDERFLNSESAGFSTNFNKKNISLRFYQTAVIKKSLERSRGIIALATGAGKTVVACELVAQANKKPVLFVVPSAALLSQTYTEMKSMIEVDGDVVNIGRIGDNICDVQLESINVSTYHSILAAFDKRYVPSKGKIEDIVPEKNFKTLEQLKSDFEHDKDVFEKKISQLQLSDSKQINKTLSIEKKQMDKSYKSLQNRISALKNKENIRKLVSECSVLIIDEAHIAAEIIELISLNANKAYYKWGLSATPYRTDNQEIRIEGALGRLIVHIPASDLIDWDFLVIPYIYFQPIKSNIQESTYAECYQSNIVNNNERNGYIKQYAEFLHRNGIPVMIFVDFLEHGFLLESIIDNAVFVPGSAKQKTDEFSDSEEEISYRKQMLNKTERNEIILIATQWANTGIDAPKIQGLIMGGSNSSPCILMQQTGRALRKSDGKRFAIVIDFMDKHKYFRDHSNQRKSIYERERNYQVLVLK